MEWFEQKGVALKIEEDGRVFLLVIVRKQLLIVSFQRQRSTIFQFLKEIQFIRLENIHHLGRSKQVKEPLGQNNL